MVHKTNCVLRSLSIHDGDAIQNITDNINLHSLKLVRDFSISLSLSNAGEFFGVSFLGTASKFVFLYLRQP